MMRRSIRTVVLLFWLSSYLDHPSTDAFLLSHTSIWTASYRLQYGLPSKYIPSSVVKRKGTAISGDGADDVTPTSTSSSSSSSMSYTVQVWYEGQSCDVQVMDDETILSALERNLVSDRLGLPNHMVPYDCRKGSCLTCTGAHATTSSVEAAKNGSIVANSKNSGGGGGGGDGLSPHMSEQLKDRGYVLTCSTKVAGEGLQLVLGEHNKVWEEMYQQRLEDDEARKIGWAAMALTKRKSDERNVPRWKRRTEAVLERTSTGSIGVDTTEPF